MQEAQERLAGAPADLAREAQRLRRAELVGASRRRERRRRRRRGTIRRRARAAPSALARPRRSSVAVNSATERSKCVAAGALIAADVVRHREQVHRLGDAAAVAEPLEDRERLLVMREPRLRLLEVDVPVADAIQAARDERRRRRSRAPRRARRGGSRRRASSRAPPTACPARGAPPSRAR